MCDTMALGFAVLLYQVTCDDDIAEMIGDMLSSLVSDALLLDEPGNGVVDDWSLD